MSDVDDLLAQAEEAQREYAEYALKADEARRKADAARVAAARAGELTAHDYARLPAPDETHLRRLRQHEATGVDEVGTPVPGHQSYAERIGDTGVGVDDPDEVEEVVYTDHTGKVMSQPDAYDRADVQLYEQEHAGVPAEDDAGVVDEPVELDDEDEA